MSVVLQDGNLSQEEAMVRALTHDRAEVRIMARASCAKWTAEFQRWVEDEANRPKADHAALLQAVATVQIQSFASIVAQLVEKSGHRAVVALYVEMAQDVMLRHIDRTEKFVRQPEEGA